MSDSLREAVEKEMRAVATSDRVHLRIDSAVKVAVEMIQQRERELAEWRAMPLSKRLSMEMERADDCEKRAEAAEKALAESEHEREELGIEVERLEEERDAARRLYELAWDDPSATRPEPPWRVKR